MSRIDRFKGATWFPEEKVNTFIGGAGGIGSWLTVLLTRASFITHVYDFDRVEQHNLGGQLFLNNSVGEQKVSALGKTIGQISDSSFYRERNEAVTTTTPISNFCFSAFDNMEARQILFKRWKEIYGEREDAIFIDGRLLAEQLQIFCIKGKDTAAIQEYEENYLFDDSEVEDAPCTMKQTSHVAAMIAGFMVSFFTNFYSNIKNENQDRDIPFYWEYIIPAALGFEKNVEVTQATVIEELPEGIESQQEINFSQSGVIRAESVF